MCFVVLSVFSTLVAAAVVGAAPSQPPLPPAPTAPPPSSFNLLMPNVQPQEADTYLCNAVKVDEDHQYLTGFDPHANSHDAHHMLLYGCDTPGMEPGNVWNCGEMSSSSSSSSFPKAGVCASGHNIMYAWAMDAPKLNLPTGVGFDVGQETAVKYLVLQVHYKNVSKFTPPENGHDNSGLVIHTTSTRLPKQAGVYLLATGGQIPDHSIEYFESACEFDDDSEIVPFAFRTHAHSLGRVISGYRVRDGQWSELGRKDPRLPEMFYNVTTPNTTIRKGDILAARCTMENNQDHTVMIGNTQNDEMCNFYIMYYVERSPPPATKQCVTPGPPAWSWKDFEDQQKLNLVNVPVTASVIPGTKKLLVKNAVASPSVLFDPLLASEVNEEIAAGQALGLDNGRKSDGLTPEIPGVFQEQTVERLLDEAINDMSPDELLYLIQQLAREEQEQEEAEVEEEARRRMWIQRQRMRERNLMYPN